MKTVDIIIFGTGLFYQRRKEGLPPCTNIVAFIDNNTEIQGTFLDGVVVVNPNALSDLKYDYIVLGSTVPNEMKTQLLEMGIEETKILYWEQYVSENSHGILLKYESNRNICRQKKSALIIIPIINYAGGFMTAFYAGQALEKKGYYVVMTAPVANEAVIREVNEVGIDVWICPSIPYISEKELKWIKGFDLVLSNSLQTMICAERIADSKNTLWWLHEHSGQYKDILAQYKPEVDVTKFKNIKIYAVSNLARENFVKFFPTAEVGILPFGISDLYTNNKSKNNQKIIFAVIGNISALKNQILLVRAFSNLSEKEQRSSECWIIGRDGGKKYKEKLVSYVQEKPYVKLRGEFTRAEMQKAYQDIDVVVCTSVEETMSMTIVEGMMNAKVCITNTNTGVAEFIQNGENGFVYEAGNEKQLTEIVGYIIKNFSRMDKLRKKARETYLDVFSMSEFSDRLTKIYDIYS